MYVLLGANGNITSKAAHTLLSRGERIRVIGRSAQNLAALKNAGAEIAVGNVADVGFLTAALEGSRALYAMLPANYQAADYLSDQNRVGAAIASAARKSGVKRIVHLSSTGAHLPGGTGLIRTLHAQEQRFNDITNAEILHLRPGFFFENHLHAIPTILTFGIYADMIDPNLPIPSIATADIAAIVVRELTKQESSTGQRVLHLHGPDFHTQTAAAAILGKAVGVPHLQYVQADPAQAKAGMAQAGMSPNVCDLFEEMDSAFALPQFKAELEAGPTEVTATTLEAFAATFRAAYDKARSQAREPSLA